MTMDLRSMLHDLADSEGAEMARTAPASSVEARRVRARARRRRAIRLGGTTGVAAASLVVAVLAAQGLTTTPPVPAVPAPAMITERTPTPAPTRPTPRLTPRPTPAPTTTAPPPPALVWPTSVDEEEVMHGGPGPWWVVWVAMTPGADLPSDDPDALADLPALGYSVAGTPVRCVVGSHEALGLDPAADPWGWPVYFRSEGDAETFVRSWGRPVAGVVADTDLACDWG